MLVTKEFAFVTLEALNRAKQLISNPEDWTKSVFARNKVGKAVATWSTDAVCFCALGSIQKAYYEMGFTIVRLNESGASLWLNKTCSNEYGRATQDYNDDTGTTHKDIMNLFDKTIKDFSNNK